MTPEEQKLLEQIRYTGSSSKAGAVTQVFEFGGKQFSVNITPEMISQAKSAGTIGDQMQPLIDKLALQTVRDYQAGTFQKQEPIVKPAIPIFTSSGVTPTSAVQTSRLPGESITDFTSRIGGIPTSSSLAQTSESQRITDRLKAIQQSLGIPPTGLSFGESDKQRLNLARQERDTITTETEGILQERLRLQGEFQKFSLTAGQGVSEAGRIGGTQEKGREIQFQLDALDRRELVLETKLRNRNTVISELMQFQRQSYEDAVQNYNTRFTQALQLYSLFDKEDDELKQNAKANLEVLVGSLGTQIKAGKLTFENITGLQQRKIEEYELQAGYPLGSTMAVLQTLKPEEEVLYKNVDRLGNFNVITKTADNTLSLKTITGAVSPQPTTTGTTGGNYNTRLNQEINNLYNGRYGAEGARERVISILENEFKGIDVAKDVYTRAPDGWEKNVKKTAGGQDQLDFNVL